MTDDLQKRSVAAMESIAKSLNILAENVEESRVFRKDMDKIVTEMEKKLIEMQDNPFGLNERD